MLHSGCVKLHQKFRDFVGLPMGLLREESPKNRMNTGLFGSRSGEVRSQSSSSRSTVLKEIIQPNIEKEQISPKASSFRGFLYIIQMRFMNVLVILQ